jgi:hypothetical protein
MNEHILLVMKWLNDAESVSREELESNYESAYYAYQSAYYVDAYESESAYYAYYGADADWAAYRAAYRAAAYSVADVTRGVSHWVDRHFQITGEDKQTYIDALGE